MASNHDFFIIRMGDINDPAAPLEFYPPKGSDELHDALKRAYPHLPNLQSRMREAVIEFYLKEQSAEYDFASQPTPDMLGSNFVPSPTSSFGASADPTIYTPSQPEEASSSSAQTPASAAPAQQDLMNVWTLPTSTQTKIHKRRNMTAEEKVKYKAKRLTGACEDCRRRRRKCEHERSPTQNVSPITSSKVSQQKKSSASRPLTSRPLSAKPALAPAAPPAVQFDDSFLFTGKSFDISTPFSTEMSAVDPSMLSLESTLGADSTWDMPFDLGNDFDLSPFLADMSQTDWDMTNSWLGNFDLIQANPAALATYVNSTADGGRSQHSILRHANHQPMSEVDLLADRRNRPSPNVSESVSSGDMPPVIPIDISPMTKSIRNERPANGSGAPEHIPTLTSDLHTVQPQSAGPPAFSTTRFSTSSLAKGQQLRKRKSDSGASRSISTEEQQPQCPTPEYRRVPRRIQATANTSAGDQQLQLCAPELWPSGRRAERVGNSSERSTMTSATSKATSTGNPSQHSTVSLSTSIPTALALASLLRTGLIWGLCTLLLCCAVVQSHASLKMLATVPLAMVFFEDKSGSGVFGRIGRWERGKGLASSGMVKMGRLADCRYRRVEDWYV